MVGWNFRSKSEKGGRRRLLLLAFFLEWFSRCGVFDLLSVSFGVLFFRNWGDLKGIFGGNLGRVVNRHEEAGFRLLLCKFSPPLLGEMPLH